MCVQVPHSLNPFMCAIDFDTEGASGGLSGSVFVGEEGVIRWPFIISSFGSHVHSLLELVETGTKRYLTSNLIVALVYLTMPVPHSRTEKMKLGGQHLQSLASESQLNSMWVKQLINENLAIGLRHSIERLREGIGSSCQALDGNSDKRFSPAMSERAFWVPNLVFSCPPLDHALEDEEGARMGNLEWEALGGKRVLDGWIERVACHYRSSTGDLKA
ncbi:hypothetical protein F5141DRAFT_1067265 [Pisolithus sp. B1]|nr:hypothetical protein F5141DRAFT_1067265 [Pisolithus sp. B1]